MKRNIKQKVLLPSLKERQRYVIYSTFVKGNNIPDINNQIYGQVRSILGVFEASNAGLMNMKYNQETGKGIIRVDNKYVDKLKIALGMIKSVKNKDISKDSNKNNVKDIYTDVLVDCDYVTGLLNKAESRINLMN